MKGNGLLFFLLSLSLPLNADRAIEKRLCKDTSVSMTCGDHVCQGQETFLNCPGDCTRDNKDFTFEKDKSASYNARTWCNEVSKVFDPKDMNGILEAIQYAKRNRLRIKPVGSSHTDNELICTDGVLITSRGLTSIYGIETFEGEEVVHAQAGVTIGDLGDYLHTLHKGLGYAIVGYEKVRIAGVTGTGAHGSSPKFTSILSDRVISMRMALADGSIKEFSKGTTGQTDPELWKALKVHLGQAGVIHDLRLSIEDEFHVLMKTKSYPDKGLFEANGVMDYIKDCDIAHVNWMPKREGFKDFKGKVIVHCGKAIYKEPNESWVNFSKKAHKNAHYVLHEPHAGDISLHVVKEILHRATCEFRTACWMEAVRRKTIISHSPYVYEGKFGMKHDPDGIRGWSHRMQNSAGSPQGDAIRQTDWEVAIPASKAAEAFTLIREMFEDDNGAKGRCLPMIGLYMRFGVANDTLMSHAAAGGDFVLGEPVIFLEIPEFIPSYNIKSDEDKRVAAQLLDRYEAPLRHFVETMVTKLGARVHWAKNRHELFETVIKEPVRTQQMKTFAQQISKLDPQGWFSNSFTEALNINHFRPEHDSL